jgi:hypothetical protein
MARQKGFHADRRFDGDDETDGMGDAPPVDVTVSGEFLKVQTDKIDEQGRELGRRETRIEQYERTIRDLNDKLQVALANEQNADAVLKIAIDRAHKMADEKDRVAADLLKEMRTNGESRQTITLHENTIITLRETVDAQRKVIGELRAALEKRS